MKLPTTTETYIMLRDQADNAFTAWRDSQNPEDWDFFEAQESLASEFAYSNEDLIEWNTVDG